MVQRHGQLEGEVQRTGQALESLRSAAAESASTTSSECDPQFLAERARAAGAEAARQVLGSEGAELNRQLQAFTRGLTEHFEQLSREVTERVTAAGQAGAAPHPAVVGQVEQLTRYVAQVGERIRGVM